MGNRDAKQFLKAACDFIEKHLDDSSIGTLDSSGNASAWIYYDNGQRYSHDSIRFEYFSSTKFFLINVYTRGESNFYIRLEREKITVVERSTGLRENEEPSTNETFESVVNLMNKVMARVLQRPTNERTSDDTVSAYGIQKLKNVYETIRSEAIDAAERTKRVVNAIGNSSATFQEAFTAIEEITRERDKFKSFVSKLGRSNCWCGVSIDNPMLGGRHTELCNQIKHAMGE